jgi:hypothetical protein
LRANRLLVAAFLAGALVLAHAGGAAAATGPTVECGQLTGYTAPDPVAPAAGSLQIGVLTAWEVVPTATVSSAAAARLPSIVNSGPTCVSIEFNLDGKVTSIDFAPQGQVTGHVTFDAGTAMYLFANRLIVPTFVTDAYPGLAALFVASYEAGTSVSLTFSVDVTSGAFIGFDGEAHFCGVASVTKDGDGKIGEAVIPKAVLDAGEVASILGSGGRNTCAAVHAVGTFVAAEGGGGSLSIDTVVTITVAAPAVTPGPTHRPVPIPTLPPTATGDPTPASTDAIPAFPVLVMAIVVLMCLMTRRGAADRG